MCSGASPNCDRVRGSVHPGKVTSPLKGSKYNKYLIYVVRQLGKVVFDNLELQLRPLLLLFPAHLLDK